MKNNRLVCLVSLLLVTVTPACGGPETPVHAPSTLETRPLDPNGKSVTLTWSFGGSSCAQRPEFTSVHVSIDNEVLENAGSFPCSANGLDGVTLTHFSPGRYKYTIHADYDIGRDRVDYEHFGYLEVGTAEVVEHVNLLCRYGPPC